jgi:hypothetical protein
VKLGDYWQWFVESQTPLQQSSPSPWQDVPVTPQQRLFRWQA